MSINPNKLITVQWTSHGPGEGTRSVICSRWVKVVHSGDLDTPGSKIEAIAGDRKKKLFKAKIIEFDAKLAEEGFIITEKPTEPEELATKDDLVEPLEKKLKYLDDCITGEKSENDDISDKNSEHNSSRNSELTFGETEEKVQNPNVDKNNLTFMETPTKISSTVNEGESLLSPPQFISFDSPEKQQKSQPVFELKNDPAVEQIKKHLTSQFTGLENKIFSAM